MFDISFSELMIIAIVALIVIGPEKLPKVARTAGAFFGRMQRFVAQVKDEINREARFAELQHLQQEVQSSLQQGVQDIEQSILPPASVTATAAQATTIEGEATPTKQPRKPRAKKTSQATENTATEVAASKPTRRRKSTTTASEALSVADAAKLDSADKPVVATQPRKPRAAKPKADTAS